MSFPHECGDEFQRLVAAGADPAAVVPDDYVIVRGGTKPVPSAGVEFSCAAGPTMDAAGSAVQHGQVRATTAGAIRAAGGSVIWLPEFSPRGTMNLQHVNVVEPAAATFSEPIPNPTARRERIDEGK